MNEETECNKAQLMDVFVEIPLETRINANRFCMLCDNVQTCFVQIDECMFELLALKDKLLLQSLPPPLFVRLTLVLSRVYRAYSQTRIPVHDLIRLVQLESKSFNLKYTVLKSLYNGSDTRHRMVHLALQKSTILERKIKQYQEQKCIDNWEKMYLRLALPRSDVRRWKFRLQTFREKAVLGYEHVIEWLHTTVSRPSSVSENLRIEKSIDDYEVDEFERSDEINSVQDIDEQQSLSNHGSDHGEEVGSDNEGSLLSSAGTEKSEQSEPQQSILIKVDSEVQAQPDLDEQQTSTDDILLTRFLIMRVYRPTGLFKRTFQCIVHAQDQAYSTKEFNFEELHGSKEDKIKNKARLAESGMMKPTDSKLKPSSDVSAVPTDIDVNTIEKQHYDELLIPRSSLHASIRNDIDLNTIKIDVLGDKKLFGSLIFSSEDLQLLDLPTLYNQTAPSLIAIDEHLSTKNTRFDFDQSSHDVYHSWISQTPFTYPICNDKHEPIAQLPLLMFWYDKMEASHTTKCTMTTPVVEHEIVETKRSEVIDMIKATYEHQIMKIHEDYQVEIDRLTQLLTKKLSSQMADILEVDENVSEIVHEGLSTIRRQHPKHEVVMKHQQTNTRRECSSKNFLDRTEMYSKQSLIYRHHLMTKYERETAFANECQMAIQHRLHRSREQNRHTDDDLCLPAVFMPFRSGHTFNPKAYQYFHSVGTTDLRLDQSSSVPSKSMSVLNLYELTRQYNHDNTKEPPIH